MRLGVNCRPYLFLIAAGILLFGAAFVWFNNSDPRFTLNYFSNKAMFEEQNQIQNWNQKLERFNVNCSSQTLEMRMPQGLLYNQPSAVKGRTDVVTVTPWLAPIVWEGTFDSLLLDSIYLSKNLTIATTVFAVGKYVSFLKDFLETAEQHFMVGYRVHYYVFTDVPNEVPAVALGPGRRLSVIQSPGSNRWQEISSRRMEMIQETIEKVVRAEAQYIFCLDVDTKFYGRWGAESLGRLVACIHPGYYEGTSRDNFPYERRPESQAYIPAGEGDYYYGGAVIGGQVEEVHALARWCREQLDADSAKGIEAAWQEESHLNRYFLYNKPSKVLSPEYLWQDFKARPEEVHLLRFSQVNKNYAEVRPNE